MGSALQSTPVASVCTENLCKLFQGMVQALL